jgi:acid phosphatase
MSLSLGVVGVGLLTRSDSILIYPHVRAPNPSTTTPSSLYFDYIVTIVLENQGINNTYGSHCSGNCAYITQLANSYGLALNYSAVGHPSLPNYLALTSGGNYDTPPFDRDCFPQSSGCFVSALNIVDSIDGSGRTWRAYMEDDTGGCSHTVTVYYLNQHNPFVYYTDISNNATRCSRIVNANPGASGYLALPTQLLSDLNSTSSASNYMWLTPNVCDDGHNVCAPLNNTVSQQNQYLSQVVPKILNSTIFRTQRAALFIAWDESATTRNNIVTAIWTGPAARTGFASAWPYGHYSAIKTMEVAWNLPSLTSYDSTAPAMIQFFTAFPLINSGGGRPPLRM